MMEYPYDKFGDCGFSRFGSIMRTDTQTGAGEALLPQPRWRE